MSPLSTTLLVLHSHLSNSFVLQFFFVSCALLAIGLALKVWFHAFKLVWLDSMTLDKVEEHHPYIPDVSVISKVAIATISLVILGSFLIAKFTPLNSAYEFIYIFGILFYGIYP